MSTSSTPNSIGGTNKCRWCASYHSGKCPKVKAIEYHPNGSVKRVEFHDRSRGFRVHHGEE